MTNNFPWRLERYYPVLRVQVRKLHLDPRLRRRFDSSDLVQETYVKAVKGKDGFRGLTEAELISWLLTILRNTVKDAIRKDEPDVKVEKYVDDSFRMEEVLPDGSSRPSAALRREELYLRLADALEKLPDDWQNAVIARHLLGLKVDEIAAQMSTPEHRVTVKAVAGYLDRGREKLRKLLGD